MDLPKFPLKLRITTHKTINDDLLTIEYFCLNGAHPRIFRWTVDGLLISAPNRMSEIGRIVSGVADSIKRAGRVKKEEPSTHGVPERQVHAIKSGLQSLEAIQPEAVTQVETQKNAEYRKEAREWAIKEDTKDLNKFLGIEIRALDLQPPVVYDMEDIQETAIPISPRRITCLDVRRYLQSNDLATRPDLWAQYSSTDPRGHAHVELLWKLLRPGDKVQGQHLKFVDRTDQDGISTKSGRYIVALKFMTKYNRTLPVPLDLACLEDPCCSSKCASLIAHLGRVWPDDQVTDAWTIRDGHSVLNEPFDDGICGPFTNDLCLHVN